MPAPDLPALALSVRQPWAWAIIHAGKPVENRSSYAVGIGGMKRAIGQRIAIHAAKGLTREEYESARDFMRSIGVTCPEPWQLERGGIVGSVRVTDIVKAHTSPWFFGPSALVLTAPEACPLVPCPGELGLFTWRPGDPAAVPPLAKWMQPPVGKLTAPTVAETQKEMF